MAKEHKIEVEAECATCDGTGLYKGMGERDGFAVVCSHCEGSAKCTLTLEWNDFNGRNERSDVTRVLRTNPGIAVGTDSDRGLSAESFGGLPYADWLAGHTFGPGGEDRQHTCPAWFYQSADYERKPDWDNCAGCGTFYDCKNFDNKVACWARFDKEGK